MLLVANLAVTKCNVTKSNVMSVLLGNPGALGLLVNMPEGLREDPYHWTELPSLNKDYYYYYYNIPKNGLKPHLRMLSESCPIEF